MEAQAIVTGSVVMIALLLIPGYALARGLFSRRQTSTLWLIGLSFFFGLVPPLILFALNKNAGVPINQNTALLALAFVTVAGAVLWWGRQDR